MGCLSVLHFNEIMKRFCLKLSLILVFTLSVFLSFAQNIATVVGNRSAGFSGDGGSATAAAINAPSGIFITSSGVLYFCDQANNRVRRVSTGGIITTVAGNGVAGAAGDGGMATAARLDNPMGVTVDAAGNVYIADYNNAKIRKVNTSGVITTLIGTGAPGFSANGTAATIATIAKPTGVAVDAAGNVYFSEQNNHIIRKIGTTGYISTVAGNQSPSFSGDGGAATAAGISYPAGLFFDASGNLIIVDNGNGRIRKVNTSGIISTLAGNGGSGFSGDGGPATASAFNNLSGAAYDASGNLLIADQNNYRIRKVSTTGTITTVAGTGAAGYAGDGSAATACSFYRPSGVAVYAGNIYVTDMGNSAIRLIGTSTVSNAPAFLGGVSQTLNACSGVASSLNSLLSISDINSGQTETWTVVSAPAHGALTGFSYATTSTGAVITPTGLSYRPTAGYTGTDSFRIRISDGGLTSSTLILVTVSPTPVAGVISGVTHVCPMLRTTFTTSGTSGGTWSTSNASLAYADGTGPGVIFHTGAGVVTISYTVSNACGTSVATKLDTVLALPVMSTIVGSPTIAIGASVAFTATPSGGVWAISSATVATVTTAGSVRGNGAGTASVFYSLTNTCGTTSAVYDITVAAPSVVQNIYKFAGSSTGASGYRATDNYAGTCLLAGPTGIAKDKNRFIYFTELGNNVVRKVNRRIGAMSLVAGNGTIGYSGDGGAATAAKLNTPAGIAIDKVGNVYIADQGNARIRKVSPTNIITTIAGTGTVGYTADGGAATSANIAPPQAVAVDTSGNVYFVEQNNHRVRKISTTGILTTVAGNGSATFSGDGAAATAAALSYPAGIFVDAAKNLYIADAGNNRIRKVSTAGIITTIAGSGASGYTGDGGAATAAKLYNPSAVAMDSLGNLFIADRNNNVVRKVAGGLISTVAGSGIAGYTGDGAVATAARMYFPNGLLCDSTNIYVADYGNNVVRVIGTCNYKYSRPIPVNPTVNLSLCLNSSAKRLDSLLAVRDSSSGTSDIWSVSRWPLRGTLTGFNNSRNTNGGLLLPSGLFYTPIAGYSGVDTFTIKVGSVSDSCLIYCYVKIGAPVTVAAIGGPSTVNIEAPVLLTESTPSGTWSSSNTGIASITNTGVLIGVAVGAATISYSIVNGCGTYRATKAITVGNAVANPSIYSFAGNGTAGYMNPMFWSTPTGSLWGPSGMAKNNSGIFIYSEQFNQDVNLISRDAYTFYLLAGPGSGFTPAGLAIDKYDNKFIADIGNAKIIKLGTTSSGVYAGTGTPGFTADGASAATASIGQPLSIAVDSTGNLYFVEGAYNRVRKINASTGILTTVAGNGTSSFSGDGGPATAATLSSPTGVWADRFGNIFIADAGNHRIRRVNASGTITTIAGNGTAGFSGDGGPATAAKLNNPYGITTDSVGCVYIADRNNNRVRKVSVTGVISTVAGNGTAGYSGDDMPATSAQLSAPQGVMCDGNDLYILDFGNNTIRVVGNIYYAHTPPTPLGSSFNLNVCNGASVSLDSLCAVTNTTYNDVVDIWRAAVAPARGALSGFPYSYTPTRGVLTRPSGLLYTAPTGYTGADSFTVTVGDRFGHITIKFYVNVLSVPTVAAITGAATVAISTPVSFTTATTGGTWSSTNTARATVTTAGLVRGVAAGAVTIRYGVTNACGTTYATKAITVVAGKEDNLANETMDEFAGIQVHPNPANSTISISLPANAIQAVITLSDYTGRVVAQATTQASAHSLDVNNLPSGTYILNITTDKQVLTEKLVICH